jgi:uncharacterized protein YqgV (UPF0045/DUF77 family)
MDDARKGIASMLLELSESGKGRHRQASDPSEAVNRIIGASGLHYKSTDKGTVLEGSWEQLMAVAKKCHDGALKKNDQLITSMKTVDKHCSEAPAPSGCSGKELEEVSDDGEWLIL